MADIDSVIAQGTGSGGLSQLGSIMNLGNQAQQLKNAQLANQQGQITLQNSQATQQADQAKSIADSQTAQENAAQQKLVTLRAHMANAGQQLAQLYGTGATPDQVGELFKTTMTNAGAPPAAINQALAQLPTDPAQVDKFIVTNLAKSLSVASQLDHIAPPAQMLNTGGATVPIVGGNPQLTGQNPASQYGAGITNTVPIESRNTVQFNGQGQPMTIGKDAAGNVTGITGTPVAGKVTQPFIMPANENEGTKTYAQGIRQSANDAAAAVPAAQAFANNAIQYANGATTGIAAHTWNAIKGQVIDTPLTADSVTDSNLMGHALSQLTGSLVKSTGLSTNQGQSLVANQVADGSWTKPAIQAASREVRALSTGADLYNRGVENTVSRVAQTDPSASQFAPRDFQNAWSKVADVNAFKLYDAIKNRQTDPAGLTNPQGTGILDKLGGPTAKNPKGSIVYQQTLKNIDKMKVLLSGGQ